MMTDDQTCGLLLIDKPVGPTSHDVVDAVRDVLKMKRVGHLGTLDPLASGLLLVAVGKATKSAQHIVKSVKEYAFTLKLGMKTDTDDLAGEVIGTGDVPRDAVRKLEGALHKYVGRVKQTPPLYSAVKIKGRRSCDLARRGKQVALPSRDVDIFELRIDGAELPNVDMYLRCGSGTYVRSLCRDLGDAIGCLGTAAGIRRLRIGEYVVGDALALDRVMGMRSDELGGFAIPVD